MDTAKAAISGNESGGYDLDGPTVLRGEYAGDHAVGKYRVMTKDLPDRLAKAGLPPMTPEQFKASRDAQEIEFEHEFGALISKYGSFRCCLDVVQWPSDEGERHL
jgi:hypothetical protein